jgi:hypothetical protein
MKNLIPGIVLLSLPIVVSNVSGDPPARGSTGITFTVCDVKPATTPLDDTDYRDALESRIGPFEASSHADRRIVPTHANALLETAYRAFSDHHPLVLTPDEIWLAICQGFAMHVDAHAEELRHRIVAHEGKKVISLYREKGAFWKGNPNNPWEGVFAEMCDSMEVYLVSDLRELLVPTFTTTGHAEQAAFEVAFMDALDSYFRYEVIVFCGVPSITLEGSPEDWERIRRNAEKLRDYDLGWWIDALLPILDQFVAASRGEVDRDFWGSIYSREAMSGYPQVTGWLLKLFPYLPGKKGEGVRRNPYIETDPPLNRGLSISEFPTGVSKADFLLIDRTVAPPDTFPMQFLAGYVGIFQDLQTLALQPEIGWIVRDNPDGGGP